MITDRLIRAIFDGKEPEASEALAKLNRDHGPAFAEYIVEMVEAAQSALARDRAIKALPGDNVERARAASDT